MAEALHHGQWNFNPYCQNFSKLYIYGTFNCTKAISNVPLYKWEHIFDSNTVPASNDGTMKHNFSWCSTGSTTLTCCVKWRRLRTSDRDDHNKTSQCHLILGSTDTHTAQLAKFSVKLLQFSLAETAQYVTQCSWCCMQGISLLITPATVWSTIYLNLTSSNNQRDAA